VTPAAWLRSLTSREFATLTLVTAVLCASFGFSGALLDMGHGRAAGAGTGVTGVVTGAWHGRGDQ
jgi:hypothetical protein